MKIAKVVTFTRKMGLRYILFRIYYELCRKYGLMSLLYPVKVTQKIHLSLREWRTTAKQFFIDRSSSYFYTDEEKTLLKSSTRSIKSGKVQFFTKEWFDLGKDYDWATNPENGFRFDKDLHWTKVNDFSDQGDIKYVWEKARFSYLYTIVRNDLANDEDNSDFALREILSWIENTRYNCGPHYKCSQEISIRVLNWIFFLNFYKDASTLTEKTFSEVINSIYLQTKHVERNILFSKIAVRNNHAITESLCLFTVGLLFPWFPESKRWRNKGKKFLEEEGLYQIYEDGSYIQHSFNYQRVVVQLYTWAIVLAGMNKISFSPLLLERLKKCVSFLNKFIDSENGYVPNWGANDSALFFPLNGREPRDFRPQVNALYSLLFGKALYGDNGLQEDVYWFSGNKLVCRKEVKIPDIQPAVQAFPKGGYYILRGHVSNTFIRCAKYIHRPYHADNLHVDIWYNQKNIIRDAGTYKYNTDSDFIRFFSGTAGHNTLMIDELDQMEKGARFIWHEWSEAQDASVSEEQEYLLFRGTINVFLYIKKGITHTRSVKAYKNLPLWLIHDTITGADEHRFSQHWNISDDFFEDGLEIKSISNDVELEPEEKDVWHSEYYGQKQAAKQIIFNTSHSEFNTAIYHRTIQNMIGKYLQ